MNSKDRYIAPELKLVGETGEVVFGIPGIGDDYASEFYIPEMNFAAD